MTVGGGVAPSVLETLEFPAALERVAAHAAGPLGAARVTRRSPATDPDAIRAALAQVPSPSPILPPPWSCSASRGARSRVPRSRRWDAPSPPPASWPAIWPDWRPTRRAPPR